MIIDEEFLQKEWPQNCGDTLRILKKTEEKDKDGKFLFECEFIRYSYKIKSIKKLIIEGRIINPQIEIVEFVNKEWKQNCGDILRIIRKTEERQVYSNGKIGHILFECEFINHPCKIKAAKDKIIRGVVNNPQIEIDEFINKEWLQNCGDTLIILSRSDQFRIYNGNKKEYKWICKFKNHECIVHAFKHDIKIGSVNNPQIEVENFINKKWFQNCGDTLKIIRKTNEREISADNKIGAILFEAEFQKYPCIIKATKGKIMEGRVVNPILPWKNKKFLQKYIEENFQEKPTLQEVADSLNIFRTTIGKAINQFGLRDLIQYYSNQEENSVKEFIQSIYKEEVQTYSGVKEDNYLEIDIYLPKLKFGVEFNGNYWHSNLYKENNYHQEKSLHFQNKNIQLFHIFEFEWLEKREICESLIKTKLGIYKEKIGARQCQIKEIKNYQEYAQFCNKNHLQGEAGARVKLGLYYKEELVQIMSFGSPRFTSDFEWEIIRECSKLGYFIIGGKQKLWRYFIENYNPKSVISYCDFSKFDGDSYLKLGFKQIRLNKPGFWWYDEENKEILWRDPFHHKEYKDKGYLQIFDCGQLVFEWRKY